MDIEQFWTIVQSVHNASGGDMTKKFELMSNKLVEMNSDDRKSFENLFHEVEKKIYQAPDRLWNVCHQLRGFCSDDTFNDFCGSLISRGKSEYEKALSDPEFLLKNNIYPNDILFYESFSYVFLEDE